MNLKILWGIIYNRGNITPKYAMVDITNNCGLYCKMCFNHSPLLKKDTNYENWKAGTMDYNVFSSIVKELYKMKTKYIIICGEGEPFLHPDIDRMISLLNKYNFKIHIITNGIHIEKNMLEYFMKIKLERLSISIHAADNQTYNLLHPLSTNNQLDILKKKLLYLKEKKKIIKNKYPHITIINVISSLNYDTVSNMTKFAEDIGAERICFKPLIIKNDIKELSLKSHHIEMLKSELTALKNNIKLEHNINEFINALVNSRIKLQKSKMLIKNKFCFLPWVRTNITTEGKIVGCIYQKEKLFLGDVTKNSFYEIWNSKEYSHFRENRLCYKNCLGEAMYPFISVINNVLQHFG